MTITTATTPPPPAKTILNMTVYQAIFIFTMPPTLSSEIDFNHIVTSTSVRSANFFEAIV